MYTKSSQQVLEILDVKSDRGLPEEQVSRYRKQYGENVFKREKPVSFGWRVMAASREPMILMLFFAAIITLAVNLVRRFTGGEADYLECAGIFAAIILSVVITVVMEGRSAKAFEELAKINESLLIKTIRSGKVQLVPQREVVVGDILFLETGDQLPVDGRLIESAALKVDESALTGESMPVDKEAQMILAIDAPVAERANMLYSGSYILGGCAVLAVTAVGEHTEFGKIATELSTTIKTSTPLQEKMNRLGKRITVAGTAAAILVFVVQVALFFKKGIASFDTISEAFITSIVLIVAAVPEGLPTIVAVALAINIIKMSGQNALVKKMIACETVGCINVICSDKTGTLTENRMTVTQIVGQEGYWQPADLQHEAILTNFCVNSTADVAVDEAGQVKFFGNPTECALLVAAQTAGWDYKVHRSRAVVAHIFPFCSEDKNMTTIVAGAGVYIAYSKGSPEKILAACTLADETRAAILAQIVKFQQQAYRIIAFSHSIFNDKPVFDKSIIEQAMVFDGFVAITDPLRPDVFAAVDCCRKAGIGIKILTGDNIVTATAIANELQLLDGGHIAIEAKTIENMSDEELAGMLPSIRVIARSTPAVKMRIVNALKANGDVVAVTGDGINDAPALKHADVGIAMGISGTDVSKEASDIVLLDDSFATITKAVQWGRGIYDNFQRFIQFQLTVNLSSVVVVLSAIAMGFAAPFSALQLLWINIVMDGPPALTLGLEPIRENLMKRCPTRRDENIVSRPMLTGILLHGVYISTVFMLQLTHNFLGASPQQEATVLFTLFVILQLFNAFNCRELGSYSVLRNLAANRLMLVVFFVTFMLQVVITQFGGTFYGTIALPAIMWLKLLSTGATVIVVGELWKLIQRRWAAN